MTNVPTRPHSERAAALIAQYRAAGLMAATAESLPPAGSSRGCWGAIPGSSNVLERGFVVYSNEAKQELLGVPAETLLRAVRRGQRRGRRRGAMAEGALGRNRTQTSRSASPASPGRTGGRLQKPVGLVHFACARRGAADRGARGALRRHRPRGRAVRRRTHLHVAARPPGTRRAREFRRGAAE